MYIAAQFFSGSGTLALGLTPDIKIWKVSDASSVVDGTMTERTGGWYTYNFTTFDPQVDYFGHCDGGATLPADQRYKSIGTDGSQDIITTVSGMVNTMSGNVLTEIDANETKIDTLTTNLAAVDVAVTNISAMTDSISAKTAYVLGLTQHNFRIKDQVYSWVSSASLLSTATIRIYPDATNATNDTNPIKEYDLAATYDVSGNTTSYLVTEA